MQGDAARLIYLHVPVAIAMNVGFGLTTLGSVVWLWKRSRWWDTVAVSACEVGLVYTDRVDGAGGNRVLAADARIIFRSIYSLQLQGGGSQTRSNGVAAVAPIWQGIFSRDGRHFGFKYSLTGIRDDFRADSGFISRGGIVHGNLNHRATWYGGEKGRLQSWTTGVQLDGIWQYKRVVVGEPLLEKKLHFNNTFKFQGGWTAGACSSTSPIAPTPRASSCCRPRPRPGTWSGP